jgi:hypothetical protein
VARIRLDVKCDDVMRLARLSDPAGAVEELIWNALDADATDIRVQTALNPVSATERITASDGGHGMGLCTFSTRFPEFSSRARVRRGR